MKSSIRDFKVALDNTQPNNFDPNYILMLTAPVFKTNNNIGY